MLRKYTYKYVSRITYQIWSARVGPWHRKCAEGALVPVEHKLLVKHPKEPQANPKHLFYLLSNEMTPLYQPTHSPSPILHTRIGGNPLGTGNQPHKCLCPPQPRSLPLTMYIGFD